MKEKTNMRLLVLTPCGKFEKAKLDTVFSLTDKLCLRSYPIFVTSYLGELRKELTFCLLVSG